MFESHPTDTIISPWASEAHALTRLLWPLSTAILETKLKWQVIQRLLIMTLGSFTYALAPDSTKRGNYLQRMSIIDWNQQNRCWWFGRNAHGRSFVSARKKSGDVHNRLRCNNMKKLQHMTDFQGVEQCHRETSSLFQSWHRRAQQTLLLYQCRTCCCHKRPSHSMASVKRQRIKSRYLTERNCSHRKPDMAYLFRVIQCHDAWISFMGFICPFNEMHIPGLRSTEKLLSIVADFTGPTLIQGLLQTESRMTGNQ